jgi:glutamine synthetase
MANATEIVTKIKDEEISLSETCLLYIGGILKHASSHGDAPR